MKKEIKKNTLKKNINTSLMAVRGVSDESGLEQYIQSVQKFPILSAKEEYNYAVDWKKTENHSSAEKIIASHLRLVVSVAYDFRNYGIPVGDLIASGNMGLMQAMQKFDPERGFRFSTYAMFWIKAEMYENILSNWSMAKIGTSANQKRVFFNLSRAKRELGIMDNNLSDVQTRKIADKLNVKEKDVTRMATRMGARDLSLNTPMGSDDSRDMLSNLADEKNTVDKKIEALEFRRRGMALLKKHMGNLPKRDQEILKARKLDDPVKTLEVLSKEYGISRERVRQIEERAFKKLQAAILKDAASQN